MPDQSPRKARLRQQLRQRRQSLGPTEQLSAAEAVAALFPTIPGWSSTRRIALYIARDGEIDTMPLRAICLEAGMQLFLPVITGRDSLDFAGWTEDSGLVANRYGIPEPAATAPRCNARQLDLLVMPLVGWDRDGGRLGMGAGFYDRTLAGVQGPLLVGLAHSLQELPRVPRDDWDVPLDFVVTESALYHCQDARRQAAINPE